MRSLSNTIDILELINYVDNVLAGNGFRGWKGLIKLEKYSILAGEPSISSIANFMKELMMYGSKGLDQYLTDEKRLHSLVNDIIKLEATMKKLLTYIADSMIALATALEEKGLTSDAAVFYLNYIHQKTLADTRLHDIQSPIESLRIVKNNIPAVSQNIEKVLSDLNVELCFPGSLCIPKIQDLETLSLKDVAKAVKNHQFDPKDSRRLGLKFVKKRIREISEKLLGASEPMILLSFEDLNQELLDKSDPKTVLLYNNKNRVLVEIAKTLAYTSIPIYSMRGQGHALYSLEDMWINSNEIEIKNRLIEYYKGHPVVTLYRALNTIFNMMIPDYAPGLTIVGGKIYICNDVFEKVSCRKLDSDALDLTKRLVNKYMSRPFKIQDIEDIDKKIGLSLFLEIL